MTDDKDETEIALLELSVEAEVTDDKDETETVLLDLVYKFKRAAEIFDKENPTYGRAVRHCAWMVELLIRIRQDNKIAGGSVDGNLGA